MTQQQINVAVNAVLERSGQRIGFPDGRYFGECTAIAAWYLHFLGINSLPYMYADRADGWGKQFPSELAPYFKDEPFTPGKAYPYGTIMMWDSPHIAIVLHSDGTNTVTCFEQNADPNGAVCKTIAREVNNAYHRANYVLIPIVDAPVAATPAPPKNPCYYEPVSQHVMQTKLQPTNWYNLNNTSWPALANNPAAQLDKGHAFTVGGYAISSVAPGEKYAMTPEDYNRAINGDLSTNNGVNTKDLEELPPPPPAPYVPPAAPLQAKLAEQYTVFVTIPYFDTPGKAGNHSGQAKPLQPGVYYVFNRDDRTGSINLTTAASKDMTWWINPMDNIKEEPKQNVPVSVPSPTQTTTQSVPTPTSVTVTTTVPVTKLDVNGWKSLAPLTRDGSSIKYINIMTMPIQIYDLDGRHEPLTMPPYKIDADGHKIPTEVHLVQTFEKDGVLYGRTQAAAKQELWYGIPMSAVDVHPSYFETQVGIVERAAMRTLRFFDQPSMIGYKFGKFIDGIKQTKRSK